MAVADKLRFKQDSPLLVLNMPDDCLGIFDAFEVKTNFTGKAKYNQCILFACNKVDLDKHYEKLISRLEKDAVVWIAYPKKSSGIISDLVRDEGWDAINQSTYHFVSSAFISDVWSGMRIKEKDLSKTYLRDKTAKERNTEGIDYEKRTVALPADVKAAMKPFMGLEDFFNAMSFTHKKEYVEAIVEAKKPETRQRRIDKMIEMVTTLKVAKENKKK